MCTTCTPHVCRATYWIYWNWNYRCSCGCWKLNPILLGRNNNKSSLTAESSLQTHMANWIRFTNTFLKFSKVQQYPFITIKSYKSDRFYGIGTKSTGQLKKGTSFTFHWQRCPQFDGHVSIQVWEVSRITLQHACYQDCLHCQEHKGWNKKSGWI